MDISHLLLQYLITFGWAVTGAVSMAVALSILIKIFSWISPIDEWKEVARGNMSMAVVLASVVLGTALVIGFTLMS
ncbi:hypothetical protein A3D88_04765 [Candidatus Peribacteria bacterium RIFCSPHIGHO2_02_FULL_52_16]|nr:MAG: hypothetical protein A2706_03395 [Candidatus Peribacteria bacterium RIFCSPHIGHO2_01_FULL_51_35]OGJ60913.1 MAG: hypothetical protein A3D88_04765 [Candidatus Peribacteria bacterium RIFCSPHIGHO2_02_FULL_52_16]